MLGGNAVVPCPNNVCDGFTGGGEFFQFVAGAGGAAGYVLFSDIQQGMYEWNGTFYSDTQFQNEIVNPNVELVREQMVEAMSLASNSPDGSNWNYIYANLDPDDENGNLQIHGGNVDFSWSGDDSYLDFVPESAWDNGPNGGCTLCRYGGMDAIHFSNGLFHLDTAGVQWGFGLELFCT